MNFDIIVIGSGPGGYVAAIRASQLGMKSGNCWTRRTGRHLPQLGCIPTKALLKSAQVFHYAKHAADYGIVLDGAIRSDFEAIVNRSRGVADGMSKGVQFLMKKNKIEIISGTAKVQPGAKCRVTAADEAPPCTKPNTLYWPRAHVRASCLTWRLTEKRL